MPIKGMNEAIVAVIYFSVRIGIIGMAEDKPKFYQIHAVMTDKEDQTKDTKTQ